MSNRTYYRGHDAVVTDRLFVWHTTPTKGFVVRDLQNVGLFCSEVSWLRPYTAGLTGGALVMIAATWTLRDTPAAYATGFLAVAVLAFLATTGRHRPRRWELLATYRGYEVMLYASADVRVFNQVARALRRAVEDSRPAGKHKLAA